ncbi:MAG: BtpA/SgcQ family protein [Patescibacteria group bacterium]|nr:BtpA/SgcQ family protein [Patescibacteria group bacterium]
MYRFIEVFGGGKPESWNRKVFHVVIHLPLLDAYETAHRETAIAESVGADGVFLIDMSCSQYGDVLVSIADAVARSHPGFFVGINDLMANDPSETIGRVAGTSISGIWSDRTGDRDLVQEARKATGWDGLLYAGVIFKGQSDFYTPDEQIPEVVERALPYVNVPVTSGPGTGIAADVRRIRLVREAAGTSVPLAIASGVSPENVTSYLPFIDNVLASTSLVDADDRLVSGRVEELATKIRTWRS